MEAVFEILLEIVFTLYYGVAIAIVPNRQFKRWQRVVLLIVSIVVSSCALAMLIAGPIMISYGTYTTLGIVFCCVGSLVLVLHVTLFFVLRHRNKKMGEKDSEAQKNNSIEIVRDTFSSQSGKQSAAVAKGPDPAAAETAAADSGSGETYTESNGEGDRAEAV